MTFDEAVAQTLALLLGDHKDRPYARHIQLQSAVNRPTGDAYTFSPLVGHFPARPERNGAKSQHESQSLA
jgi:hypothetical protein